eukprot:2119975-Amphidinium_carterae.1
MLPIYRKDHNGLAMQNLTFPEIDFHPQAEAHTSRYLKHMKLPNESYDRACTVRPEPPVRIQLLMHYDRILPPNPVDLKLCKQYFSNPPREATKPNQVLDEIVRWKGIGWRLKKLAKHYPTLNEMIEGFTTLIRGIVDAVPDFRAKYEHHAMNINNMTVTTEQVTFFSQVESLLNEFHSSKGYCVLSPLVDHRQKGLQQKGPKVNGADGNKNQEVPDQKGKKGAGKGNKSGKKMERTTLPRRRKSSRPLVPHLAYLPMWESNQKVENHQSHLLRKVTAKGERETSRNTSAFSFSMVIATRPIYIWSSGRSRWQTPEGSKRGVRDVREKGEGEKRPSPSESVHDHGGRGNLDCSWANCMVLPNHQRFKGSPIRCTLPGENVVVGQVIQVLSMKDNDTKVKVVALQGAAPIMPMVILVDMTGWKIETTNTTLALDTCCWPSANVTEIFFTPVASGGIMDMSSKKLVAPVSTIEHEAPNVEHVNNAL